jgi:hypothetical protein
MTKSATEPPGQVIGGYRERHSLGIPQQNFLVKKTWPVTSVALVANQ